MLAKELAAFLAEEAMKTDLSAFAFGDMSERFESLRGYRFLPTGRTKNVTHLSLAEISAAILSIATVKPGYAGLAAKVLRELRPVGGINASFYGNATFGKAIERLLDDQVALESLMEVRVSDSEIYTNSHCRAAITYRSGDAVTTAHYIGALATLLLQPNAEKTFDPRKPFPRS